MKALLSLLLIAGTLAAQTPTLPMATTSSGLVLGRTLPGGIHVFKGIPFAAPPIGRRRWQPPAPAVPWTGVRCCLAFSHSCPQPANPLTPRPLGRQDEDCLYLNVWTASLQADARRPVMVWIHGGGNTIGSASLPYYDGAHLARLGVVLVSINYRLGPFGFLAHPALSAESPEGISGNYGILDQIAALQWVRSNIKAFGGDPAKVTIFGESAGGVDVCTLLVTPRAKGLFHRAISQSGTAQFVRQHLKKKVKRHRGAEQEGLLLARRLGIKGLDNKRLAALRRVPAERLLGRAKASVGMFAKGYKYGPVVDGTLLPGPPAELLAAGRFHRVPLLIGANADEATLFLGRLPIRNPGGYKLLLGFLFPGYRKELLTLFPAQKRADLQPTLNRLITTMAFVEPARSVARAVAAHQERVWLYHFTRVPQVAGGRFRNMGATHGLEIPYVFGNATLLGTLPTRDREVSQEMARCWTRFAATGNPNQEGTKVWPPYTTSGDRHWEFGDKSLAGKNLRKKECDLLRRVRRSSF